MTVVAKKISTKKPNIALCAGFILLCLTLFSMHFTSDLYARYVSKDSAEDSARVIKFGEITLTEVGDFVTAGGSSSPAVLIPGTDLEKEVKVSFTGSESATYVFVKVDVIAPWRFDSSSRMFFVGTGLLQWRVAEGWNYLKDSNYVFYYELEPNEEFNDVDFIHDRIVKVSHTLEVDYINSQANNLRIGLKAYVVQSNGFKNPSDAWASVRGKGV